MRLLQTDSGQSRKSSTMNAISALQDLGATLQARLGSKPNSDEKRSQSPPSRSKPTSSHVDDGLHRSIIVSEIRDAAFQGMNSSKGAHSSR